MSRPYVVVSVLLLMGLFLLAGCLSSPPSAQGKAEKTPMNSLTYYTEQMPPQNYMENGTLQGFSVDLLEAVTGKMGDKVLRDQVRLVPWSEGYQAALTQNRTVLFAIARQPARENLFKWAGPVSSVQEVLFARPGSGIMITEQADLRKYRIGAVVDDLAVQQLIDAGVDRNRLVLDDNATNLVEKLANGEIDLWAYPEPVGRDFAKKVTGNAYTFAVVWSFPPIDMYYAFSKDVPDDTVRSFQQALDDIRNEKDSSGTSRYDRIIGKYVPSIGLADLQYLTEEWAPFNYEENGNATGISVDILGAVFSNMGVNRTRADVRIVPLAEGFRAAQDSGTVLFSIVRTPEREPLYRWAGPFTRSGFVIYAPRSRNITITNDSDLNRYRIGAVRSSIENDLLASRGINKSSIVPGEDPEECLRMLEKGQIDLWATGDLAGRHQMIRTAADPNAYEIVSTLSEYDFYFIISRDVPETLVNAFQDGLDSVRTRRDEKGVSEYERILYRYLGVGCTRQPFGDERVTDLVNTTAAAIRKNASDTFHRINAGEAPFLDPENPALYVFVYDQNETVVAHAGNPSEVGVNNRGKTDVTGKAYHDQIAAGAEATGAGWVEYVYVNPAEPNLFEKKTYFRRAAGSDGKIYYVCSGNFKGCGA